MFVNGEESKDLSSKGGKKMSLFFIVLSLLRNNKNCMKYNSNDIKNRYDCYRVIYCLILADKGEKNL